MSSQSEPRKPEEIESDIHQTRARLDDTLHALEERFSPQQLMSDAFDYVRQGGANDFMANLGRTVKQNPVPVMLTGVGLGWLMISQRRAGRHSHSAAITTPTASTHAPAPSHIPPSARATATQSVGAGATTGAGTTTYGTDPATSVTPSPATPSVATPGVATPGVSTPGMKGDSHYDSGASHQKQGRSGAMKDRAHHMTDNVKGRAQHMTSTLRDKTANAKSSSRAAMHNMSHRAQDAGAQTTHFIQEHPIVAGALGIAIGAALGSLFPATRIENERMGGMRDKAMHKAAEAGEHQADKAQAKVHEKAEQAKSDAAASSHASEKSGGAGTMATPGTATPGDSTVTSPTTRPTPGGSASTDTDSGHPPSRGG